MSLLDDYPLVPVCPLTGPVLCLRWWTHGMQNRVILAPTERGVDAAARVALQEEEGEPRAFYQGTVVCPPKSLCLKYARWARKDELSSFRTWVLWLARSYYVDTGKAPAGFRVCTYAPRRGSPDDPIDEMEQKYHNFCRNCDGDGGGMALASNLETLFEQYKDRFRAAEKYSEPPRFRGTHQARREGPLWCFQHQGGHHRSGVLVKEAHEFYPNLPVLFFLQGEELPIPARYLAWKEEREEAHRARDKAAKEKFRQRREAEEQEHVRLSRSLFD